MYIAGGSLLIGDGSETSCANFHLYESKTVSAIFSNDGAKGSITFKQDNPYRPTEVTVSLQVAHDLRVFKYIILSIY